MGFPDDLPDVGRLQPPANSRPEGIEQSYFAQRLRGELFPLMLHTVRPVMA